MFDKIKKRIKNKIRNIIGYNELISMKELVTESFEGGEGRNAIRHNELIDMMKRLVKESYESEEGRNTIRHNELIDMMKRLVKESYGSEEDRNVIRHNELIDMMKRLVIAPLGIILGGGSSDNSFWKDYSGFTSKDIPLLQKYIHKEALSGKDGYITDFLGIRHNVDFFPKNYMNISGAVFQKLPIPDDGFHSETIEYVASLTSIENAGSAYTMFELGAGWGPWMSITGTAAKKKGISTINLIGVEGEHKRMSFIKKHLTENGLRPDTEEMKACLDNVNTIIYDGVVNTTGDDMEFPDTDHNAYGASLVEGVGSGMFLKNNLVKGYSLAAISSDYDYIDLIHIDIQGYEKELVSKSIDILKKKVKFLFIGTHSREIEGHLFNILYENGFRLIREQPCRVLWPESKPNNFIDVTVKDGGQFWINKQLNI